MISSGTTGMYIFGMNKRRRLNLQTRKMSSDYHKYCMLHVKLLLGSYCCTFLYLNASQKFGASNNRFFKVNSPLAIIYLLVKISYIKSRLELIQISILSSNQFFIFDNSQGSIAKLLGNALNACAR